MIFKDYILGRQELYKAVWLNIAAQFIIILGVRLAADAELLPNFTSLKNVIDVVIFSIYMFALLVFDYMVWVCANNSTNQFFKYIGKLFALKNLVILILFFLAPYI